MPNQKAYGLTLADRLKKQIVVSDDPFFSSVVLMLHMNGSNNGTTFVDSSKNHFTLSPSANYVTSTANVKYGTASGYFPASNANALTLPTSSSLTLTGDFTIEFWLNVTTTNPNCVPLGSNYVPGGINNQIQINEDGAGAIGMYNGSWHVSSSGVSITANTWHYLAFSRIGSILRIYYDGNKLGNDIASTTGTFNLSGGSIGALHGYSNQQLLGYMDDFRITTVGRYSGSTMVVPAGPSTP